MKKKKILLALVATSEQLGATKQQLVEALLERDISSAAHKTMCADWEEAAKRAERYHIVLARIEKHRAKDSQFVDSVRQWIRQALADDGTEEA